MWARYKSQNSVNACEDPRMGRSKIKSSWRKIKFLDSEVTARLKSFSDGKLSLDVFGVFLCQIIDQIYAFPGITETRILKQFDYVCPRTSLLDFLARLELTGIIIKQRVKYQEPRLVSKEFPDFFYQVECVFPMVAVSILPRAETGPNDHR